MSKKEKKSIETDGVDNPLSDALLSYLHANMEDVLDQWYGEWEEDWVAQQRQRYPELPNPPPKPALEVKKIKWQNLLHARIAKGRADHDKHITRQPFGFVDMSVLFTESKLLVEFTDDAESCVWVISEYEHPTITIHILCRPLLKSAAKTIREINGFLDRPNEDNRGYNHSNNEQFAVLTCNPRHEEIFLDQGFLYFYFPENIVMAELQ